MIFLLIGVLAVLPHAAVGSIKVAESYWTLKANELVVDEDMDKYGTKVLVPLVCGEAFEGQKIIWKREGREELPFQGNRVFVMVEERQGGTYTCYSTEGNYLNHTLVLVQWRYRKIIKGTPERGYVHCSTNNYSGFFQCFWTWDESRSGKVALIKITRSHTAGNTSCNLDSNAGSITCQDHAFCPYAEEIDHINLTIYFRSNYVIETYYLQFRISDIVRPDMVRFKMKSNILELQYPKSWSTPFSYFPLRFQVKEIRCQKKRICDCSNQRSSNVDLTQEQQWPLKKGVTVCVRAQDGLANSSWGEWNQFKWQKTAQEMHCHKSCCNMEKWMGPCYRTLISDKRSIY
ncbi:interleukin 12Ba isoform X2 [Hemibagrus wyckioides]|uniref:interleukin 12Ba isoform X2 n=1 Tax=Hemibagrus wyckioides TaxID=337641 RepID=UPI00266C9A78|nr:interleukin 12Ba isoform X2 [Hemibagrus wyckioides]